MRPLKFHDLSNELVAAKKVEIAINDDVKKTTAVYREMLYHVITKMKKKNKEHREREKQHEEQSGGL